MKRNGERGEGKFERISWDEALAIVAEQIKRVKEIYGPASILLATGGGDHGRLHNADHIHRLFALNGGYTTTWGVPSCEGAIFASLATYGTTETGNAREDLLNSRFIVMWGLDVVNTVHGNSTRLCLARAKEKGIKIVCVDPKYTASAATFADQWIPIRPGTDTAMLIAMAYTIIEENLHDRTFLDRYTTGFDRFRDYVTGKEDGIARTPLWAEGITGVKADVIAGLAREYATSKPAALMPGLSAGRTANGEQFHRAAIVLAAMTGNVGIPGGNSGTGAFGDIYHYSLRRMSKIENPVDKAASRRKNALAASGPFGSSVRLHNSEVWDAIIKGKAGGYPADYKMLFVMNWNYLNQSPNINKGVRALNALEFIVVQEQFLTATARFADILLPSAYFLERNDLTTGNYQPFYGYVNRIVEPYYEAKSHIEIATELAERLGISGFSEKSGEELLEWMAEDLEDDVDYDTIKDRVLYKVNPSTSGIAFKDQIDDLQNNPFPTPSGKIEIYSQQLADMENPLIPPVPKYIEMWESPNDPLAQKYPLQLITTHPKLRVHSQFYGVPRLTELEPQVVFINTGDARARDIEDGERVRVFNDRGEMIIAARVTERIMPGVIDIAEGAWYTPDENGADTAGCANILCRDTFSPAGAFTSNTGLVQVRKYKE
ncbi:MAG: molybdopterin-dependent oxidoreductase, partial [Dehalococcoidia bacterium]